MQQGDHGEHSAEVVVPLLGKSDADVPSPHCIIPPGYFTRLIEQRHGQRRPPLFTIQRWDGKEVLRVDSLQ